MYKSYFLANLKPLEVAKPTLSYMYDKVNPRSLFGYDVQHTKNLNLFHCRCTVAYKTFFSSYCMILDCSSSKMNSALLATEVSKT